MYRWIGKLTMHPHRMARVTRWALAIPRPIAFSLVTLLGWAIFLCNRDARQTITRNMGELLPATTPRDRRRLCRRYIVHECLSVYEQGIDYRRSLAKKSSVRFDVEGRQFLDEALALGRGVIVLTPHVGNFFYFYWQLAQHYDCLTVVTAGSPELRPLFLGFHGIGLQALDYDREPPLALTVKLRHHLQRNGLVLLLGDFSRPAFDACTLFGKPSPTPAGAAMLAIRQRVPIVPLSGWRESWFRHRMEFGPPIFLYERYTKDQRAEALRELAQVMEQSIRRAPEQWLYWFNVHERWTSPA